MSDGLPKNQIRSRNSVEQHEHEKDASARRVVLVDKLGEFVEIVTGSDGKKRLAVDAAIPISDPTIVVELNPDDDAVAISSHPNPIHEKSANTLTNANFKEIFSYTSDDDRTRIIKLDCTADTPTLFRVKIDGEVERQAWSSPLERNVTIKFDEHFPLPQNAVLTVEAKVQRLIHSSYDTFVSMEGYIREP